MKTYSQYFDWAATSPADRGIALEALNVSQEFYANPSSVHKAGIDAHAKIEEARKRCARVLNILPGTLIFTSGGTESNHIPILSLLTRPSAGSILIGSTEHAAVREQAYALKHAGWTVLTADCTKSGIIGPDEVLKKLRDDTALVCVMAVNNETGAIQPIYEIADALSARTGKKRPKFHVDAVQACGKIPLDLSHAGIDTAAISAHKIYGMRGTGLLYSAVRQEPFLRGGGQEGGIRSGTENLFGIWALTLCLEKYAARQNFEHSAENQKKRCARFIGGLSTVASCTIIPQNRIREPELYSPWIVQASFKGIPGEVMVRALSARGFYISTGSACSSHKSGTNAGRPVLEAMGIDKESALCSVRFSFGAHTRDEDIDNLLEAVQKTVKELGGGN